MLGGGAVGIDETLHAIPVDDHLRAAPGVGSTQIPESARGWIHKAGNDGFIKLIHDADTGVLVGATSTGPVGGEVLSALIVAVHARVPVQTMRQMICTFPTFHRAIEAALDNLE